MLDFRRNKSSQAPDNGPQTAPGDALDALDVGTATAAPGTDAPVGTRRRGIGGVALLGRAVLLTGAVVVFAFGSVAWWTIERESGYDRALSLREAELTVAAVASALEPLADAPSLSPLRRLVTESALRGGLEEVSVSLPDGQVLAHSEPARINLRSLPATWPAGTVDTGPAAQSDVVTQTVVVPGRGPVIVSVRPKREPAALLSGVSLKLLAGAALVSLASLYVAFRRLARPLRPLGLVAEALGTYARHADTARGDLAGLLSMDERHGPEAAAFNRLLRDAAGLSDAARVFGVASPAPLDPAPASSEASTDPEPAGPRTPIAAPDLAHAINILPTGVLVISTDGTLRACNNMGAALSGGTPETLLGKPLTDLFDGNADIAALLEQLRDGTLARRTLDVKRASPMGESVLRVQVRPLRKDDAGAALLTLEDVTQQRLADQSRNLFVAQATHELRTPLTNMRLAVETVMEEADAVPPSVAPHLNMIQGEVRRLERMVGEMLAVSEIEAGSLRLSRAEIQLERLVHELEHDHRPAADKKNIALTFSLPPKYPQLYGDREKLAQALHNLVGNAVKYTPAGGSVKVLVSADGPRVSFAVTDTGYGISPDDQNRLFQRFSRGSDPRVAKITGTGLGLALSRDIARLHGGDITLESEVDKGSTFTLSIPTGRTDRQAA